MRKYGKSDLEKPQLEIMQAIFVICVDFHHTNKSKQLEICFGERFARKQQIPEVNATQRDFKTIKNQTARGRCLTRVG